MLVELLDSHPQIRCESEILLDAPPKPEALIRARAKEAGGRGQVYGFKFMAHHASWQPKAFDSMREFVAMLHSEGFGLIVLRRRRMLDQAVSVLVAEQVGYHPRRGDGVRLTSFEADTADLLSVLVFLDQQRILLEEAVSSLPHLSLFYEDDIESDAQGAAARVSSWLGLPAAVGVSDLVRPMGSRPTSGLANPETVAAALRVTRFAELAAQLEDPPSSQHLSAEAPRFSVAREATPRP